MQTKQILFLILLFANAAAVSLLAQDPQKPTIKITRASPALPGKKSYVTGSVEDSVPGAMILISVRHSDGQMAPPPDGVRVQIHGDGTFIADDIDLVSGDTVLAQLRDSGGKPIADEATWLVQKRCKDGASAHGLIPPTIFLVAEDKNDVDVTSSVKTSGSEVVSDVYICDNNNLVVAELHSDDPKNAETRTFIAKHLSLQTKAEVYVEVRAGDKTFVTSEAGFVPEVNTLTGDYRVALVGGFEVGGYSSQSQNTNAFVQLFLETPARRYPVNSLRKPQISTTSKKRFDPHIYLSSWGRIRLLGAASPNTSGVGSAFTDPSGAITKQDFSSIGQALDYTAGFQVLLRPESTTFGRVGFIVGGGATTPLDSSQTSLTFKAPSLSTSECASLIDRFSLAAQGYKGGKEYIDPVTMKTSPQCLLSKDGSTAIKDIAFANQDRSNFLGKWGVGIRSVGTQNCAKGRAQCADALALLDVSFGQDAALTGGQMHNFVVKFDGLLPIKTGDAAYLYLFGSAYTRLMRNKSQEPLILAAESTKPALPDPSVIVLPFTQPNRDYYRLGIGLNLQQIFCKLGTTLCDTKK